jgi:phage terminase Nu1 subunit (DNA packaging protein)
MSTMRAVPDQLVKREELAEIMRVSVPTVDRMRRAGMPCVTWGRRLVRFRVADAIAWTEQQQRGEDT